MSVDFGDFTSFLVDFAGVLAGLDLLPRLVSFFFVSLVSFSPFFLGFSLGYDFFLASTDFL